MIHHLLFLLAASLIYPNATAHEDRILGVWYNEEKDGKIEVYKRGDQYHGKIIWIKNNQNDDGSTPKTDLNNPDPEKRNRPIVGTRILKGLEWDQADDEWDDGKIYDPRSGNTYDVYAELKDPTLYT